MEQTRPYQRNLYRLSVTCPAMYSVTSTVDEGTIMNLSAVGCTIETDQPLLADQNVALRLMLPDQHESLPIDKPKYGGCMASWQELNSSKWNLPQISGPTVSYKTGWSYTSTRFNRSARKGNGVTNRCPSSSHQPRLIPFSLE
jgi:hypothetical protein